MEHCEQDFLTLKDKTKAPVPCLAPTSDAELLTSDCIQDLQARIASAPSKDEALELALTAADICLKALKLASTSSDRSEIRGRCNSLLETAEQIKRANGWTASATTSSKSSPVPANYGASNGRPQSSIKVEKANSSGSNLQRNSGPAVPGTIAPQASVALRSTVDSQINSPILPFPSLHTGSDSSTISYPLDRWTTSESSQSPSLATSVNSPLSLTGAAWSTQANLPAPVLPEPISRRKLTNAEKIILLKGTKVNGYKFPEWKDAPDAAAFALPDNSQLFEDDAPLSLSPHQLEIFDGWRRARDALPPAAWFPHGRMGMGPTMRTSRPVDLVQDVGTDCSVVASMSAAAARAERGSAHLLSDILWPQDTSRQPLVSPSGKYIVRLNFNGCWRKVIIDDRLPTSKTTRMLHCIDRRNPSLLWPALLEKAYLKVRGGYDFPGSNSCNDLWALTGWIPEQIYLQDDDIIADGLWKRLYSSFQLGDVLITLGTGKMDHRSERELGLEGQHNYVVVSMRETETDKLLLVRNPWVDGKDRRATVSPVVGTYADTPYAGEEELSDTYSENLFPGTFWVKINSMLLHFETLCLNWNPRLFRYREDYHFQWKIGPEHGIGACFIGHPQFSFCSSQGGIVCFLLDRHFQDPDPQTRSDASNDGSIQTTAENPHRGSSKGFMNLYIFDNGGKQVYASDGYVDRASYTISSQNLLRFEAEPNRSYTVVVSQMELPPSEYRFSLHVYSVSPFVLDQAAKKYNGFVSLKGEWRSENAGGNSTKSTYSENPQYSLRVPRATPLALSLQTADKSVPVDVKLVHGKGKRVFSLSGQDIILEPPEYKYGYALTETTSIAPGTYTIICSMFEPDYYADFTLRVDADVECALKPIPHEGAGFLSEKLGSACFGSSTNKLAAPLHARRMTKVMIIARFQRAQLARNVPLTELKSRSPLRVTVEVGRGPQRRFVIASNNGEYSDDAQVRTEVFDLAPARTYGGDVWLVLDRLSGPVNGAEEFYDVEIFYDQPDAVVAGVWRAWD